MSKRESKTTPVENKLLWLALVSLAELVEQVKVGPSRPTAALRLALAICYKHSDGNREPFGHFWRMALDPHEHSGAMSAYCRTTDLMIELRCVLRAVGIAPSVEIEIALHKAARKGAPPHLGPLASEYSAA